MAVSNLISCPTCQAEATSFPNRKSFGGHVAGCERIHLRRQAIAEKKATYSTGKMCKYGHPAERYVSNGACVKCRSIGKSREACCPEGMFRRIRWKAAKLGIAFDLTLEDVRIAWPSDNTCPIRRVLFKTGTENHADWPSLDRRIPTLGYVKGNVLVMSCEANRIKSDITDPEVFRRLARLLEDNQTVEKQIPSTI